MPTYEAQCRKCGTTYEYSSSIEDRYNVPNCPCGGQVDKIINNAPSIRPDLNDFSNENSGKGRFNKQLNTYVTSVDNAIEKAEKRGWSVLDKS